MSGQDGPMTPSWRERREDHASSGHHGPMTPSEREMWGDQASSGQDGLLPLSRRERQGGQASSASSSRAAGGLQAVRDGVSQVSAGSSVTVPSATAIPQPSPESVRGRW